MQGVVARMAVTEVALQGWATRVTLAPQVPQPGDPHEEEIKQFFAATPSGQFTATIRNEAAAEHFQPGDVFYLRLERVKG